MEVLKKTIARNIDKATKALFSLYKMSCKLQLNMVTKIELFERMIVPILVYGCEVWGFEDLEQVHVFQRKFLRKLMFLSNGTPNAMVLGEFGVAPLKYVIKRRMLSFWLSLEQSENTKLSGTIWQLAKTGQGQSAVEMKWTSEVKKSY